MSQDTRRTKRAGRVVLQLYKEIEHESSAKTAKSDHGRKGRRRSARRPR